MSFLSDLFSGGASKLVDSIGSVLDNMITSKEEKLQLANEIAKAEMQYELEKRKMSLEEQQAILGDVQNARTREVQMQTAETTKLNKNLMPFLALGTIFITMLFFYILVFKPKSITSESRDIVLYILGILSAILTQIYSYYFGSSSGSAGKDKTISSLATKP